MSSEDSQTAKSFLRISVRCRRWLTTARGRESFVLSALYENIENVEWSHDRSMNLRWREFINASVQLWFVSSMVVEPRDSWFGRILDSATKRARWLRWVVLRVPPSAIVFWHGSLSKWQKSYRCFCSYINRSIDGKVSKPVIMIDRTVILGVCYYGQWYFARLCYGVVRRPLPRRPRAPKYRAIWTIVSTVTVPMAVAFVTTDGKVRHVNTALEKSGMNCVFFKRIQLIVEAETCLLSRRSTRRCVDPLTAHVCIALTIM